MMDNSAMRRVLDGWKIDHHAEMVLDEIHLMSARAIYEINFKAASTNRSMAQKRRWALTNKDKAK